METPISEIKNTLDGNNARLEFTEESISQFEDIAIPVIPDKTQQENKTKNCSSCKVTLGSPVYT